MSNRVALRGTLLVSVVLALGGACANPQSGPPVTQPADDTGDGDHGGGAAGAAGTGEAGGAGGAGHGGQGGQAGQAAPIAGAGGPTGTGGGEHAGGGENGMGTPPDAGSDAGPMLAKRSPGCGKTRTGNGQWTRQSTLRIAGVERSYFLYVPNNYDPNRAYPLVFTFHGCCGPAVDPALPPIGLSSVTRNDAILVAPNGTLQATVGNQPGWDLHANSADVQFFDAMLTGISESHCVDPQRVFAHGFSMGAAFSLFLGCLRGDVVRGIVAIDGGFRPPDVSPPASACKGHAAAWVVHGTNDTVVPLALATEARETLYLPRHGCSKTSRPVDPSPCVSFDGCMQGYPQVLCVTASTHNPQDAFAVPGAWNFMKALPDVTLP